MTDSIENRLRLALLDVIGASSVKDGDKQRVLERIKNMSGAELLAKFGPTGSQPPSFEQITAAYAERGLNVSKPSGNWDFGASMVCCPHDGVAYCMDAHPGQSEPDWDHGIRHRARIIKRHHHLVKAIYEQCLQATGDDVWVLSSGGSQLQAFFGNRSGYLAILYLPMADLSIEWMDNNAVFAGLNVPGVTLYQSTTPRPGRPQRGDVAAGTLVVAEPQHEFKS